MMDRVHRLSRVWSNRELRKLAPQFGGDVINVSGCRDEDKEGRHYSDYFTAASTYVVSNWQDDRQNLENEILLDLEQDLPRDMRRRYDVVFNHTTLEHVFDVFKAFGNLCELSRDIVIVVVPFMQQVHHDATYLDYWRLTPYSIERLFERNGLSCIHLAACDTPNASVYVLAVGSRHQEKWQLSFTHQSSNWFGLGCRNIRNSLARTIGASAYAMAGCIRNALRRRWNI
ncbi:MAG: hypothetical protein HY318_02500 [Armatimonadetes bacterium]|nr:hypothetical protein [Armatimonadota bacterium]